MYGVPGRLRHSHQYRPATESNGWRRFLDQIIKKSQRYRWHAELPDFGSLTRNPLGQKPISIVTKVGCRNCRSKTFRVSANLKSKRLDNPIKVAPLNGGHAEEIKRS
jgi:hypothetical protein